VDTNAQDVRNAADAQAGNVPPQLFGRAGKGWRGLTSG
jgi:hypothetical protein